MAAAQMILVRNQATHCFFPPRSLQFPPWRDPRPGPVTYQRRGALPGSKKKSTPSWMWVSHQAFGFSLCS